MNRATDLPSGARHRKDCRLIADLAVDLGTSRRMPPFDHPADVPRAFAAILKTLPDAQLFLVSARSAGVQEGRSTLGGNAGPPSRPHRATVRGYRVLSSILASLDPAEAASRIITLLESIPARSSYVVLELPLVPTAVSLSAVDRTTVSAVLEWLAIRADRRVAIIVASTAEVGVPVAELLRQSEILTVEAVNGLIGRHGDRETKRPGTDALPTPASREASVLDRLQRGIVGQPHVIHELNAAWQRRVLGLSSDRGPCDVYLFVGPPGVGKSHAARVFAEATGRAAPLLFRIPDLEAGSLGDAAPLLSHTLAADPSSAVSSSRWASPPGVVVLEGLEHASSTAFRFLFRALDEGVLPAGGGRYLSLENCDLFLPTTAGDLGRPRSVALGAGGWLGTAVTLLSRDGILARLDSHFDPALLSRISIALAFEALSRAQLGEIAFRRIEAQRSALRRRTGLDLRVDGAVGDLIIAAARVDDDARRIDSALRQHLWSPLSRILLAHKRQWDRRWKVRLSGTVPEGGRPVRALLLGESAEATRCQLGSLPDWLRLSAAGASSESVGDLRQFDAILLDLDGNNGNANRLRLLRSIRESVRSVPVLLFSGSADHALQTAYFTEGATAFVAKSETAALFSVLETVRRELVAASLARNPPRALHWETDAADDEIRIRLTPASV